MKIFPLITGAFISLSAHAFELKGLWQDIGSGDMVRFISVQGNVHYSSKMDYVDPNGRPLYSISQIAKIPRTGTRVREGKISYYDSRGCSFENLPVVVEFQNNNEVNFLATTPRYKFQKITVTRDEYNTCRTSAGYYYRCGRPRPSVSYRCEVLEYVQEPNSFVRVVK